MNAKLDIHMMMRGSSNAKWTVGVYITELPDAVLPQKSNKQRHVTHQTIYYF